MLASRTIILCFFSTIYNIYCTFINILPSHITYYYISAWMCLRVSFCFVCDVRGLVYKKVSLGRGDSSECGQCCAAVLGVDVRYYIIPRTFLLFANILCAVLKKWFFFCIVSSRVVASWFGSDLVILFGFVLQCVFPAAFSPIETLVML